MHSSRSSPSDPGVAELLRLARAVAADGWLADERWAHTRTLREAVRIYRAVLDHELPQLNDTTVALGTTLSDLVAAKPEPGSLLDRAQEASLHTATAVIDGMTLLPETRPIIVEPAQVQLLVGLEDYDVADYAASVQLAFPVVYLDFADDSYAVPQRSYHADAVAFPGWTSLLYGAFAWRVADCLAVMPMRGLIPPGATAEQTFAGSVPQALFTVMYGPRESLADHSHPNVIGLPTGGRSTCIRDKQFRLGGNTQAEQELALAIWLAGDVVDVIRFLEAGHVHTLAEPVSRQVRRQAERKNQVIPLVVEIARRSTRRGTGRHAGAQEHSHQWEVAGGYHHVTRGPHVRCSACRGEDLACGRCHGSGRDPDLVRPCLRRDLATGELTCPDGCRREWVGPDIQGPPGAPLKPKVRHLPVASAGAAA